MPGRRPPSGWSRSRRGRSLLQLLVRDPCSEDTQRLLMRCHTRLGQPQLATRQYHALAAALRAELQLAPAPATNSLAAGIRRHEQV